jgi:hypothetical protein
MSHMIPDYCLSNVRPCSLVHRYQHRQNLLPPSLRQKSALKVVAACHSETFVTTYEGAYGTCRICSKSEGLRVDSSVYALSPHSITAQVSSSKTPTVHFVVFVRTAAKHSHLTHFSPIHTFKPYSFKIRFKQKFHLLLGLPTDLFLLVLLSNILFSSHTSQAAPLASIRSS